jgi:drug/metabolite transporter (DMT)-like permease
VPTSSENTPAPIGPVGLFIPFLIVLIALLFTGPHPASIAGAALLLVVPAVILVLRRRGARTV